MILGIGTDLCDIRRIEKALDRFGDRFAARCFAEVEQQKARRRRSPAAAYAQSFAAKEACAKALGTGFRRGVFWRDMVVRNLSSGKPYMELLGGARARLDEITPAGMQARVDVSQTDEYPLAHAIVIISAVPPGTPGVPA